MGVKRTRGDGVTGGPWGGVTKEQRSRTRKLLPVSESEVQALFPHPLCAVGPFRSRQISLSLSLRLCKQHAAGGRVANGTGNDDKGTPHTERNVSFLRPMFVAQTMTEREGRTGQQINRPIEHTPIYCRWPAPLLACDTHADALA